ncbi:SDR family oxidoreductase [Paucibacter sp. DJ2R-2]|uniref:SDR family oxidoreductase n=1 Tax=Paucibacter sp. DJ2R-2 TaxID=2893558 RepID=UPI0021E39B9C|nr:SDR family oxidoreductase [Paucibacter sp. DJ2R-2]MCV2438593.1 SDR family oxidoreductase [Paucibacter sp. DJ2R-2]
MKTILITGASTGIGHAAALRFHAEGWNVAATMRKPESAGDLAGLERVVVLPLDVTDRANIAQAVQSTLTAFGGIDVLLNNAGYGLVGPLEAVQAAQLERQYATNVFGPIYTTQACLPHFRARKAGLVINVSSIGGRLALPFNSIYHGTKFAIEGLSESLALELAPHGIQVKLIEPGGVRTDFGGRSLDFMQQAGLSAYDASLKAAMSTFMEPDRAKDYSDASQIAEVIYQAATDGSAQLRYLAGKDAQAMLAHRASLTDEEYRDWVVAKFHL